MEQSTPSIDIEGLEAMIQQVAKAREGQDKDRERSLITSMMQKLGMDKFQISEPGDYFVMSQIKPSQQYQKRFTLMSFMLFMQMAIESMSDPNNPKHMSQEKIEAVKEFLYKAFVFKPDVDLGSVANKDITSPSFADYKDSVCNESYPGINFQGRKELLKTLDNGLQAIEVQGRQIPMPSINSLLNWEQFEWTNYDTIKEATNLVEFNEPHIDDVIQVHNTFPTLQQAKAYADKYRDYPLGLQVGRCGIWFINTECKENQKTIDLLGQKTKLLHDLLESNAQGLQKHSDLLKSFAKQSVSHSMEQQGIEPSYMKQFYKDLKNGDVPHGM